MYKRQILNKFKFNNNAEVEQVGEYLGVKGVLFCSLVDPRYYDLILNIYPKARPMVTGYSSLDPVAFYDDDVLIAVIAPIRG